MILMIDTTGEHIGKQISEELLQSGGNPTEMELIDTTGMHISHCVGCNYCWLKTPGICAIKEDYEPILKKMSKADQVWLISGLSIPETVIRLIWNGGAGAQRLISAAVLLAFFLQKTGRGQYHACCNYQWKSACAKIQQHGENHCFLYKRPFRKRGFF